MLDGKLGNKKDIEWSTFGGRRVDKQRHIGFPKTSNSGKEVMRSMPSGFFTREHMMSYSCALCLFIVCFGVFAKNVHDWDVRADTYGYVTQDILHPWGGDRSPGLAIFYDILGVRHDLLDLNGNIGHRDNIKISVKNFSAIDSGLVRIAYAQTFLLSFSFMLLFFALARFVPLKIAFLICLFCICFTPLPPTEAILTDSVATSLGIIFVALALFWFFKNRIIILFLLCVVAVYAVLVRPDFGFLSLAAFVLCIKSAVCSILHKMKKQAIYIFSITAFLCIGTLLWPIMLSITAGFFVSGQVEHIAKRAFAIHLLEKGDENLYEDPVSKSLVAELIERKPDFDKNVDAKFFSKKGRENYSPGYIFNRTLHPYCDFYEKHALNYFVNWNSPQERIKQTNTVCNQIIRKHFSKYLMMVKDNFISSFDFFPDMNHFYFTNNIKHIFYLPFVDVVINNIYSASLFDLHLNFYIIIFLYILIALAAILCTKSALRYPVIFISSLYILHMLLISTNHGVYLRYPKMSLITLQVAALLSIYMLFKKFCAATKHTTCIQSGIACVST